MLLLEPFCFVLFWVCLVFFVCLIVLLPKHPITLPFTRGIEFCQLMSRLHRLYPYTSERKVFGWPVRGACPVLCVPSASVLHTRLLWWWPQRGWYGHTWWCDSLFWHAHTRGVSPAPEALTVLEGRAAARMRKGLIFTVVSVLPWECGMKTPDPDVKKACNLLHCRCQLSITVSGVACSSEVCFTGSNNNWLPIRGLRGFKGAPSPLWKTLGVSTSCCDAHPRCLWSPRHSSRGSLSKKSSGSPTLCLESQAEGCRKRREGSRTWRTEGLWCPLLS